MKAHSPAGDPMPSVQTTSTRRHEQGQLFAGWVVGIFIIAAMIVYVADTMRRSRNTTQSILYRELALNVAKAGFEEGLSSYSAPTSQAWVVPWPVYPDESFEPQSTDTDFYSSITVSTDLGSACAGGIIGDVPMDQYVTYTGSDEMRGSTLWGRYVIRRQNIRNWSPGPNTMSANTDPDAAHDISAIGTQSPLGSGTRWSIASRGYLLRLPSPVTSTGYTSSLLGTPAAFAGKNLLSAPLTYYNNQRFLLAQARVYGELTRVNFNLPTSAVLVNYNSTTLSVAVYGQGVLMGTSGFAYTSSSGAQLPANVAGTVTGGLNNLTMTASISNCFPGQTWTSLRILAKSLSPSSQTTSYNPQIMGYVGGSEQLPVFGSSTYNSQVSQESFYFLNGNITLAGNSGSTPVLSGVGLCVIKGSLTIPPLNNSSWAGVLYVQGQVTLQGPATISGIIISETGISIGNATDFNKTTVSYDPGIITVVQNLLKDFTVDSSSIVANQF